MNASARRLWFWPCVIAASFLLIPLLLLRHYPISFWASTDYQTLGLADALNMAYRIADREMYFARGMTNHPGVPFYFMNWLALALTGFPVASADAGFLDRVIERIEDYHRITIWLAALPLVDPRRLDSPGSASRNWRRAIKAMSRCRAMAAR